MWWTIACSPARATTRSGSVCTAYRVRSSAVLKVTFNSYTVSFGTGGGDGSTAAKVIGQVTANMLGVRDDPAGTLDTGLPSSCWTTRLTPWPTC